MENEGKPKQHNLVDQQIDIEFNSNEKRDCNNFQSNAEIIKFSSNVKEKYEDEKMIELASFTTEKLNILATDETEASNLQYQNLVCLETNSDINANDVNFKNTKNNDSELNDAICNNQLNSEYNSLSNSILNQGNYEHHKKFVENVSLWDKEIDK